MDIATRNKENKVYIYDMMQHDTEKHFHLGDFGAHFVYK